jgi:hypothetical protein
MALPMGDPVAAHHLTPAEGSVMSLKEGVEFLRETPYPVSRTTLEMLLKGAPRRRVGRNAFVYQTADVLERHRDYVNDVKDRSAPKG